MNSIIKIFGLDGETIKEKLSDLQIENFKVTELYLDAKIVFEIDEEDRILMSEVLQTFEDYLYCIENETLEGFLFKLLKINGKMLSTAESITGGAIAHAVTRIPGASEFFYEGIVCYNKDSKIKRLGVSEETIKKHSLVSKEVAHDMVKGLCIDDHILGVSTTGVAGPEPHDGNEVGKVCIGIGSDDYIVSFERYFEGTREEIINKTKNAALFYAIRYLRSDLIKLLDTVGEYEEEE